VFAVDKLGSHSFNSFQLAACLLFSRPNFKFPAVAAKAGTQPRCDDSGRAPPPIESDSCGDPSKVSLEKTLQCRVSKPCWRLLSRVCFQIRSSFGSWPRGSVVLGRRLLAVVLPFPIVVTKTKPTLDDTAQLTFLSATTRSPLLLPSPKLSSPLLPHAFADRSAEEETCAHAQARPPPPLLVPPREHHRPTCRSALPGTVERTASWPPRSSVIRGTPTSF
jgi:hypothetical protein